MEIEGQCPICALPTNNPGMHMIWHQNQDKQHEETMQMLRALATALNRIMRKLQV